MTKEALKKLLEPLPYQWRVQEVKEYGANCVAYIDSRDVQKRLDDVVGPENWQSDYKDVTGVVYGGIGIRVNDGWVWKWDCGSESNVEKEKGEASDAFKRAGVKWGIGRFLYDLGIVKLKTGRYKEKYYPAKHTGDLIFNGADLTEYINNMKAKEVSPQQSYKKNTPTEEEKALLRKLVYSSTLADDAKLIAIESINDCKDYETYNKMGIRLRDLQVPLDPYNKPFQKDINKELLRKTA